MRTRSRLILAATFVALASGVALGGFLRGSFAPKRDVILIVIDTVRRDALGCYGNPDAPTPHMDALAAEGVRFDQAISSSGWTLPAVASLLTGAWPTIHGGLGKKVILTPIRDELPTAAEVMADAGFSTLAVANAAFVSPLLRLDRGFDIFDHRYTYNWDSRPADSTVGVAIELLREHRRRSNFLLLHLFDAHLDYDPPGAYATKYTKGRNHPAPPLTHAMCEAMQTGDGSGPPSQEDIAYIAAVYHGEIDFMDAQIGRFVAELRSMGRYDNATIIVTADHGEEFWEHEGFEHGHTLYDELIRVPLIIKFPAGIVPTVDIVETQVPTLDVMPTVFSILDIAKPETFTGESLMPLVTGQASEDRLAFSESTLYGSYLICLRGPRYKYIYDLTAREEAPGQLFDWRLDPGETNDLSREKLEVARQMHQEMMTLYGDLARRAQSMPTPKPVDLNPDRVKMLKSLGYIR